jgi:hypothetical protein
MEGLPVIRQLSELAGVMAAGNALYQSVLREARA